MSTFDRSKDVIRRSVVADHPRTSSGDHELDAAPAPPISRPPPPAARATAGRALLKALEAPAFPPVRRDASLALIRPSDGHGYFKEALVQQDRADRTRAIANTALRIPTNSAGGRAAAERHRKEPGAQQLDARSGHAVAEILSRQVKDAPQVDGARHAAADRFLSGAKDVSLKELGTQDEIRMADKEAKNAWERRMAALATELAPKQR